MPTVITTLYITAVVLVCYCAVTHAIMAGALAIGACFVAMLLRFVPARA